MDMCSTSMNNEIVIMAAEASMEDGDVGLSEVTGWYLVNIACGTDINQEASLYTIKGVAILDNDGERIVSKYYDDTFATVKEQREFEKNLFQKTSRQNAEIIMLDGLTIVYRSSVDLYFYVMGSQYENELILVSVLNAFFDAISVMLRKNVEKRFLMDCLDAVLLSIDELVDGGVILEADSSNIVQKVAIKNDLDVPLTEQTVAQVLRKAKTELNKQFLKS